MKVTLPSKKQWTRPRLIHLNAQALRQGIMKEEKHAQHLAISSRNQEAA